MQIHLPALAGIVLTYLLVFARVGAMIMLLPGIGTMGVPARVRLVLALAVAFALTPTVQSAYPAIAPTTLVQLTILIAQEITCGVLVGAMASIIMSALQVAGFLIASQIGLSYAQTIDPTQNTQGAVVGNFMSLLGVVAIFATDMHHLAIGAQLSLAAAGRPSAHRRHGAVGDPACLRLFRPGLSVGGAVSGVRLCRLCGPGPVVAVDAAIADFLCRGADQHSVRLRHHAGAARHHDHRLP
jgi:hypothetical protein